MGTTLQSNKLLICQFFDYLILYTRSSTTTTMYYYMIDGAYCSCAVRCTGAYFARGPADPPSFLGEFNNRKLVRNCCKTSYGVSHPILIYFGVQRNPLTVKSHSITS